MKTERRHELQTNELATWLTDWIETVRPYSKAIVGGLLLLATVWSAYAYITNRGEQQKAQAWSAFFKAYEQGAEPESLADVAKSYADTEAGLWALQSAADVNLAQGTQDLFRDRGQAGEGLKQAREAYATVSQRATDPLLKRRATFGEAQALESLGEFGAAEKKYQQVVDGSPESGVGQLAQGRLEMLQRPSTQEWYAWFSQQQPAPSPLADPSLFSDLPNLPDSPNISLPKPGELIRPSGDPPAAGDGPAPGVLPLNLNLDDSLPPDLEGPSTAPADDVSPSEDTTAPAPSTPDESVQEESAPDESVQEESAPDDTTPEGSSDDPTPNDNTPQTQPPNDAAGAS